MAQMGKRLSKMWETRVQSLGREDPLVKEMKEMAIHSSLLPGKSHGRRSLVGCSRWGRSESDTTERLSFHFISGPKDPAPLVQIKGRINSIFIQELDQWDLCTPDFRDRACLS